MSQANRRSFYFNEDNQDLFNFLKTKRRANEWVMDVIRQAMMTELGGGMPPATSAPQTHVDYQALIQRIQVLESQSQQFQQTPPAPPIQPPVAQAPVVEEIVPSIPEPEPMVQPVSTPGVVKMNYQINKPQPTKPTQPTKPATDPFAGIGMIGQV